MAPPNILRLAAKHYVVFRHVSPISTRQFSLTASRNYPRTDSQDRNSINTEATEYSKSGTDDGAAKQEEAAFDPSKTSPEEKMDTAGKGNKSNPLDISGANQEVSQQRDPQEGGAENSAKDGGGAQSGHGSRAKPGNKQI